MKRTLCLTFAVLVSAFFAGSNLFAQIAQTNLSEQLEFGGLRFNLVQPDGTALTPTETGFQYKDQPVDVKITTAGDKATFEFNSPFFEKGELSIGIETPGLKKLPQLTPAGKTPADGTGANSSAVTFQLSRSKTTVDWSGSTAVFTVPKKRSELSVSLAEYGAADKWVDVTRIVNKKLSGGALNFHGTNDFFGGDPAPGVVKSLVITYSLDDEETIATFGENALVRIQYDPKDYFYLLKPNGPAKFKFTVTK